MSKWIFYEKTNDSFRVAELFQLEKAMITKIENLMNLLNHELYKMKKSPYLSDEEKFDLTETVKWMNRDGNALKEDLIKKAGAIFNEHAASVFERSMHRLIRHFMRRKNLYEKGANFDAYLEWLIELPYLVEERIMSASALIPQKQYSSMKQKVKITNSVYHGNSDYENSRASTKLALCC